MDKRKVGGLTDEWVAGQMGAWVGIWTSGEEWMDKCIGGQVREWVGGWMGIRTSGQWVGGKDGN